jgi:hypothetical protein
MVAGRCARSLLRKVAAYCKRRNSRLSKPAMARASSPLWLWVGAVVALLTVGCFASSARSASVPDGRAYELVSPVDKNGGDITGDGQMVVASLSGNAIAYASRASFADTTGTGGAGQTQYIARRGASGWTTHAITPRPAPEALQVFVGSTQIPTFSDELETAILWAYDLPDVNGDSPDMLNVYREETATRTVVPLTVPLVEPLRFGDIAGAFWGASDDTTHVSLVLRRQLLAEAPAGVPTVYEWADGVLRIASVLPDGNIATDGADVLPRFYRRTVTPDGSRVLFVSPPTGDSQLYMRVDGTRTVWVSQPENDDFAGTPAEVMLQAVSEDGRHVLFTTSSSLVREDDNFGSDLYLYTDSDDPSTDSNLTLISRAGASSGGISGSDDGGAVVGTSDDASRIYFDDVNGNLYLWDHGEIKHLSSELPRGYDTRRGALLSVTDATPGASRVSPDGRHLAFLTNATAGNDQVHALTGEVTNGHLAMYAYDAEQNVLTCCSCPRTGPVTTDATVIPAATVATASSGLTGARPRYLSADGHVFFSTADALVPEDTNGATDTYECDARTGEVSLLSGGRSPDGAWFVDASASGDDVFFVTRTRLVGADRDTLVDLYDARVGGAFPEPTLSPQGCSGDTCQGAVGGALSELGIGTESFSGAGSPLGAPRRARLKLIGARVFVGTSVRVVVRVSGPGKLSWRGIGIRPGARRVSKAGTYRLRMALTRKAGTQLQTRGVYRLRVKLRFTSKEGGRSVTAVRLTFTKGR